MTLQRALSTVKRLSEEATPNYESADALMDSIRGKERLCAAAPDLAASVVEMAEALELIAVDPEFEEFAMRSQKQKARAALASFAGRFGGKE